jgi:hypothetical protein
MLASIHPLGERSRGQQFWVTIAAYTMGSVVGAAALGALLGATGQLLFDDHATMLRAAILGLGALVAVVVDRSGTRPPSWHRQVNEDWLAQFRGWIYGAGFGVQLGLGVLTIVTTASVYLTWIGAVIVANPIAGAVVGVGFGLARALPVVASASVRTPVRVAARVRTLNEWDGRFRTVTTIAEATVACVAIIVATR